MLDWQNVRRWRREQRASLVAARRALPLEERRRRAAAISDLLSTFAPLQQPRCVGFYWPMQGEPDLRSFVQGLAAHGVELALPVVVTKSAPLEFWRWRPGMRLTRQSVWRIPIPAEREAAHPDVLLVPLVGGDDACYRLGNGGGYYDRTLAVLEPQPISIGVGFELGRLATIYPQPHDVPMHALVTERGILERA